MPRKRGNVCRGLENDMNTISKITLSAMESAALARIALNNRLSDDLTQQLTGYYDTYDELVRHEIVRLCSYSFDITQSLNRGDPQLAYEIACGNPDEDGTSLGLTA